MLKKNWHVAFLNTDKRLSFYLPHSEIDFLTWNKIDASQPFKHYDMLMTRAADLHQIKNLPLYHVLFMSPHRGNRWLGHISEDAPVAVFP